MAVHNIPVPQFSNLYGADPLADRFFARCIGPGHWPDVRSRFVEMGRRAAEAGPLAALAERNPPVLRSHDDRGERIDEVVYHSAYRDLEQLAYGGGIVATKYDPAFLAQHQEVRHRVGFGCGYYFAQSESGLYCPICMTDGVGYVLERLPETAARRETLTRIATTDLRRLWQGGMFLTERQGGSDVGANAASAHERGGRWSLTGHKWFCSNVDAQALLVLARMPGGPSGTRGLGLFLLLRERPAANGRRIVIERLKDKFGTRSMPTGEVTLQGAEAELLAGIDHGFKHMAEMINLSRTYNAVASIAVGRRAVMEAAAYGYERRAFGKRLWELPLWRATIADLIAEQLAAFLTVFETVRMLDFADGGDPYGQRLLRILTPLAKAATAKLAVATVSEAMEAIGGNGYIETSPMPRLLRDAQVLPIWEGTTNILSLDLLRSMARRDSGNALVTRIESGLALAPDGELADIVAVSLDELRQELATIGAADFDQQQRWSRGFVERAWRSLGMVLLLEAACDPDLREVCLAAARRLTVRPHATAPFGAFDGVSRETEEVLLSCAFSA